MKDMLKSLMIPVETIVRPVLAPYGRKQRMREELYNHLESIYAEECQDNSDDEQALRKTLLRLGDVSLLQRELQRGIHPLTQVECWWGSLFARRENESRLKCAARVAIVSALLQLLAIFAFTSLSALWVGVASASESISISIVFSLLLGMNVFVCSLLAQPFLELTGLQRKFSHLVVSGFGVGCAFGISEYALLSLWKLVGSIPFEGMLFFSILAFLLGWSGFVYFLRQIRIEKTKVLPWLCLELVE